MGDVGADGRPSAPAQCPTLPGLPPARPPPLSGPLCCSVFLCFCGVSRPLWLASVAEPVWPAYEYAPSPDREVSLGSPWEMEMGVPARGLTSSAIRLPWRPGTSALPIPGQHGFMLLLCSAFRKVSLQFLDPSGRQEARMRHEHSDLVSSSERMLRGHPPVILLLMVSCMLTSWSWLFRILPSISFTSSIANEFCSSPSDE